MKNEGAFKMATKKFFGEYEPVQDLDIEDLKIKKDCEIKFDHEQDCVSGRLKSLGGLFDERQQQYGDSYLKLGHTLNALFPNGIHLHDEQSFNRFALFYNMVQKMCRYSENMEAGHSDSLDDISVYSQMLRDFDQNKELERELFKKGSLQEAKHKKEIKSKNELLKKERKKSRDLAKQLKELKGL